MYIGEVSKLSDLSVKTIRYYEELQLISKPARKGAYRVYNDNIIGQLLFIKQAKELGVCLNDIAKIDLKDSANIDWQDVHDQLDIIIQSKTNSIKQLQSDISNIQTIQQGIKPCLDN